MADILNNTEIVGRLAEEFVDRYRRGEYPPVSEYVARFPGYADDIRELFPALVLMENVGPSAETTGRESSRSSEPALHELGDFRIIREVGRGGMGVVYEAEQVSLGRRVALKVLPHHLLTNEKHAKRFDREARAAARLHHTNIVPVFGVGEQDDVHYYVMQFIHGLGLDEVLIELKRLRDASATARSGLPASAKQAVAAAAEPAVSHKVGAVVAQAPAMHVAHSLLTGQFEKTVLTDDSCAQSGDQKAEVRGLKAEGNTGQAERWVAADTTLAQIADTAVSSGVFVLPGQSDVRSKAQSRYVYWQSIARIGVQAADALQYAHDQGIIHRDIKPGNLLLDARGSVWVTDFGLAKATDQQDLTHTGDLLGTLRYMAPEQFDAKADARSDVYALGLTLYELLALQPGFDETDRRKLIKQVTTGAPARLRLVDPRIPRDLETIVHKAIERDPVQRYQTAGDLADDLRRYLGDEPIRARQVSPVQRLTRWCRRNPTTAVLTSTIAFLLVTAAIVSAIAAANFENLASQKADLAAAKSGLVERLQTALDVADSNLQLAKTEQLRAEQNLNHAAKAQDEAEQALAREREVASALEEMLKASYASDMQLVQRSAERANFATLTQLLERHRPQRANGEDRRGFEWYYWQNQCRRPDQSWSGHDAIVHDLAISPDGRLIATAGFDQTIRVWDMETMTALATLKGHTAEVTSVAFTANGTQLVSGSWDMTVRVWNWAEERETDTLTGHTDGIHSISLNSNGSRVASAAYDGSVRVWNLEDRRELRKLKHSAGKAAGVSFSGDDKWIAAGYSGGAVIVSDAETDKILHKLLGHAGYVTGVAFSPDQRRLASCGHDGTVRLWDLEAGKAVGKLQGHAGHVMSVAFSPTGESVVSASFDGTVRVWDVAQQIEVRRFYCSEGMQSARFTPDSGSVIAAGKDGRIQIWKLESGPRSTRLSASSAPGSGHAHFPEFSGDGRWLVIPRPIADVLECWDVRNRQLVWSAEGGRCASITSDSQRVASVRHDGLVCIRSMLTGELLASFQAQASGVHFLTYSPDDRLIATTGPHWREIYQPSSVVLWDVASGKELRKLDGHAGWVSEVAFSPVGQRLATSSIDHTVKIWDAVDWSIQTTLVGHSYWVNSVEWSRDGRILASCAFDGSVKIWDARTGTLVHDIPGHSGTANRVAISPDGRRVASGGGDHQVKVWDVTSGLEVLTLTGHESLIVGVSFSPDGNLLASVDTAGAIYLWDGTRDEPARSEGSELTHDQIPE